MLCVSVVIVVNSLVFQETPEPPPPLTPSVFISSIKTYGKLLSPSFNKNPVVLIFPLTSNGYDGEAFNIPTLLFNESTFNVFVSTVKSPVIVAFVKFPTDVNEELTTLLPNVSDDNT